MRLRANQLEEARRKVEKDTEFQKHDGETVAERIIREYRINVQPPEQNCGP